MTAKRATLVALAAIAVVCTFAALSRNWSTSTDTDAPLPGSSAITPSPSGNRRPADGAQLQPDGNGGYTISLPPRSYASREILRTGEYSTPRLESDVRLPEQAGGGERGRIVVYETDDKGKISAVIVIGNSRNADGSLTDLQWLVSATGVELAWEPNGQTPWTVTRDNSSPRHGLHGSFVDERPLHRPTRYVVQQSVPTEFTYRGKTRYSHEQNFHVVVLLPISRAIIGKPIRATRDGLSPFRAAHAG